MCRRFLEQIGGAGCVAVTGILGRYAKREQPESESVTVRIGSKPFTEQKILGYLAYERLRRIDWVRAVDEIGAENSVSNWKKPAAGGQCLYGSTQERRGVSCRPVTRDGLPIPNHSSSRFKQTLILSGSSWLTRHRSRTITHRRRREMGRADRCFVHQRLASPCPKRW